MSVPHDEHPLLSKGHLAVVTSEELGSLRNKQTMTGRAVIDVWLTWAEILPGRSELMPVISVAGMTEPRLSSNGDCCGTTRFWQVAEILEVGVEEVSFEACPLGSVFWPPNPARSAAALRSLVPAMSLVVVVGLVAASAVTSFVSPLRSLPRSMASGAS